MFTLRIFYLLLILTISCFSMPSPNTSLTKGDVRVLVILVEFADVRFENADPVSQFTDYLNKEGYNEYGNIGSVKDYFIKNSMGMFRPIFDVYGPVTLSSQKEDYKGNARLVINEVLDSLNNENEIEFRKYDKDADGVVDFFVVLYAGVSGNEVGLSNILSAQAGALGGWWNDTLSGKKMRDGAVVNSYASVPEINGLAYKRDKTTTVLCPLGVFVHEFTHIFGFPDLYVGFGTFFPVTWSVMAGGGANCMPGYEKACLPPLYSSFERISMGWLEPVELELNGYKRLDKLDENMAYRISNPNNSDEMYLLEYRTNKGWDVGQENSGMLLWYVDYDESVWKTFKVNYEHIRHVDIIEAEGNVTKVGDQPTPYDVFPGKGNVTEFNGFVFKDGLDMNITLSEITESEDKEYVTFKVTKGEPFMREVSSSSQYSCGFAELCLSSSSDSTRHGPPPSYSFVYLESSTSTAISQKLLMQTHIAMQNGMIRASTSVKGIKTIRLFSLNGQLLFETSMEGLELQFPWPRHLGKQKAFLSITRGKDVLYMGTIDGR